MTFLIDLAFRGFRFRVLSIRSSTNTDLRRVGDRFDIVCILLAIILLDSSVYDRLLGGDIFAEGFNGVLSATSVHEFSSNTNRVQHTSSWSGDIDDVAMLSASVAIIRPQMCLFDLEKLRMR